MLRKVAWAVPYTKGVAGHNSARTAPIWSLTPQGPRRQGVKAQSAESALMSVARKSPCLIPVLALLGAMAQPALAQEAGFAVEVGPSADMFMPMRVGVQVFGPTGEAAAGFVRGCPGFVAETGGAHFQVTEAMETLAFTGAGEGVEALVVASPDGLYRCARADDTIATASVARAEAGRYTVWVAGPEASSLSARIIASDASVSELELRGLDIARHGPPRAGVFGFDPAAGRQVLVQGAELFPLNEMRPLDMAGYCAGYSRFDAADAVVTLSDAQRQFSIFALSERDLTIAVVAPNGQVLCNDDAFELNPAVTFQEAEAGDYHVFVGGFSQGGEGRYDLLASPGGAQFREDTLDLSAAPRAGAGVLDITAPGAIAQIASGSLVARDPVEALPTGQFCLGYTGADAPDFVLTLTEGTPVLTLYALSQTDLVMALRGPSGDWHCNDDTYALHPAVTLSNALPGDYHIFIGAYAEGARGGYNLYAALGEPDWEGAEAGSGGAAFGSDQEPLVARIGFGPQTRIDPRLIFDILPGETSALDLGTECAGFLNPERPDVVITAEPGLPQLMVYMVAEADGTLAVVAPDGTLYCNDDFEGLNPAVMIPNPQAGDYAVFAGTYGGNGGVATMGVTIAAPLWVMDREH